MASRGFTLAELLTSVALAAVMATLAVPSFYDYLTGARATADINRLIGAVTFARAQAIVRRRTVTLCPADGHACLGRDQWHRGVLVFIDHNGNGTADGNDAVVTRLPPLRRGARIYWRAFRNRGYLQFHSAGYTRWQNGSFLYCPPDDQASHARMAIVNAQGRVRAARDSDGDGVREDARGRALRCP